MTQVQTSPSFTVCPARIRESSIAYRACWHRAFNNKVRKADIEGLIEKRLYAAVVALHLRKYKKIPREVRAAAFVQALQKNQWEQVQTWLLGTESRELLAWLRQYWKGASQTLLVEALTVYSLGPGPIAGSFNGTNLDDAIRSLSRQVAASDLANGPRGAELLAMTGSVARSLPRGRMEE